MRLLMLFAAADTPRCYATCAIILMLLPPFCRYTALYAAIFIFHFRFRYDAAMPPREYGYTATLR